MSVVVKAVDKLTGERGGMGPRKTALTKLKYQEQIPQPEVLPAYVIFPLSFHVFMIFCAQDLVHYYAFPQIIVRAADIIWTSKNSDRAFRCASGLKYTHGEHRSGERALKSGFFSV